MKRTTLLTAAVAAAVLAAGSASLAQETTQDPHHPPAGSEAQPEGNTPQLPMQNDQQGMMGMMRMMDMAQMMQMMNMMGGGGAPGPAGMGMEKMDPAGMAMVNHVEGRIAFLRVELKITDAQAGAWDAFAGALRDNARRLDEAGKAHHGDQAAAPTLEQRLAAQEQWLSARLEGVRAISAAFGHLYDALSPEQRKSADDLLAMHMGLMPVGMKPMGMMQMGSAGQ